MGILSASYHEQFFFKHETALPPLSFTALGMIGIATGVLMNLRFGVQMRHYAISLFSAIVGASVLCAKSFCIFAQASPAFVISCFRHLPLHWAVYCLWSAQGLQSFSFILYKPHEKNSVVSLTG